MKRAISCGVIFYVFATVTLADVQKETKEATPAMAAPSRTLSSGYLAPTELPSALALVPEPPTNASGAMKRDDEINQRAVAMQGSPRWTLAARDAAIGFPALTDTFACALNASLSEESTPRAMTLLRRTFVDAARATYEAKNKYRRERPFMSNGKPVCTPDQEQVLRKDGSYPSGHAALGWALALVLTEVSPEQTNALLARGRAFGESRVVCNVHWQSDVLEGQMIGSAVVARLHAVPEFRTDVEAARAELAALRSKQANVARDCAVESQALQSWR